MFDQDSNYVNDYVYFKNADYEEDIDYVTYQIETKCILLK